MGVDPDLEHREPSDQRSVEFCDVTSVGEEPGQVVEIAGGGGSVEAGDLLCDVLLQAYEVVVARSAARLRGLRDPVL